MSNQAMKRKVFNFYSKQSKLEYETQSLKMFVDLKIGKPFDAEGVVNVHFKVYKGDKHEQFDFTLTDLPMINLYDQIILLNIVFRNLMKYVRLFQS